MSHPIIEEVEDRGVVPEIFLLSLCFRNFLDEHYASLFAEISSMAVLKRAQTSMGALSYLKGHIPSAIIVTDEGLTIPKNRPVLDRVVAYVKGGGLVILGMHMPSFAKGDAINRLFEDGFGIPWRVGDYTSGSFQFHEFSTLPRGIDHEVMPSTYQMKALHVHNARPSEKIYIKLKESDDDAENYVSMDQHICVSQAAVAGARVGEGFIVYHGDVNSGEDTQKVMLGLCGL